MSLKAIRIFFLYTVLLLCVLQSESATSSATDDEIRALTEKLFAKDQSLLSSVNVYPQKKTKSSATTDEASGPLLKVASSALETNTVAKMRVLFDNYEEDTLTTEKVTASELTEENEFVNAVVSTDVMQQAMSFLQEKGFVSSGANAQSALLKELWFTQYSRGKGRVGSSGFEHVFVHEIKSDSLIGLHNWVYFADEEQAGRLNYQGYIRQLSLGTKAQVLKVRFAYNGLRKPVNGLFVGTTPELELALYTVCFKLRPDVACPVSLGNQKFEIVTYTWNYNGKKLIGSAYPDI